MLVVVLLLSFFADSSVGVDRFGLSDLLLQFLLFMVVFMLLLKSLLFIAILTYV